MPEAFAEIRIIGPGRAGLALGTALLDAGAARALEFTGRSSSPPQHPLFTGSPGARYGRAFEPPRSLDAVVVIAVPDGDIASVAETLTQCSLPSAVPVLHLSGAHGAELLSPLRERGNPTGSLHPLVSLTGANDAVRLWGAWFGIEGDPAAQRAARRMVGALEGRVLTVTPEGKALYHAAAAAASNHVVALLAVAERWMMEAGAPADDARAALVALASGAVENVGLRGPVEALTGPVARGDIGTVEAHLARLSEGDRHLYSVLARSALDLARARGLDPGAAERIAQLLESTE